MTPRFLELLSAGCHIAAHYPDNADTRFFELNKFSEDLDTYEKFAAAIDRARVEPVDMQKYSDYLSKHYTTVRAKQLKEIINDYK